MPNDRTLSGGTNSRPLRDTIGQTGGGLPDDGLSPEQRRTPERLQFSNDPALEALAEKLRREADRFLRSSRRAPGDGEDQSAGR